MGPFYTDLVVYAERIVKSTPENKHELGIILAQLQISSSNLKKELEHINKVINQIEELTSMGPRSGILRKFTESQ
jgi:hypothetical protein